MSKEEANHHNMNQEQKNGQNTSQQEADRQNVGSQETNRQSVSHEETTRPQETKHQQETKRQSQRESIRQKPEERNHPGKEEMISLMKQLTQQNGEAPTFEGFCTAANVTARTLRKNFGTWSSALQQAGLKRQGSGYPVPMDQLFRDWGGVVRRLGKIPTVSEYDRFGKHCAKPFQTRFGGWPQVPTALQVFAEKNGLAEDWQDVMEVIRAHQERTMGMALTSETRQAWSSRPCVLEDRPIYGAPLVPPPLAHAPTNELGVVYMFGMMAERLKFVVTRLQGDFPDCEAMHEMEPDRWQRLRIEFEYESRNFLKHLHLPSGCDLIVCWIHNWPDCPLPVLELRREVEKWLKASY